MVDRSDGSGGPVPSTLAGSEWQFLATTNRGTEEIANDEINTLVGAEPSLQHPGMVRFSADRDAVYQLNTRSRSLHRILIELSRTQFETLDEIYDATRILEIPRYVDTDQSFAVRAQRHGDHSFGSPDVERVVGQAIIDSYQAARNCRPPVDLDDPELIFRVLVRGEIVVLAIDTTGQRSLHRRWYRVAEHSSPLRPTLAYAMLQYAGYEPEDCLADPLCGGGTIPIEAALLAREQPPTEKYEPALVQLPFLDASRYYQLRDGYEPRDSNPAIVGMDCSENAVNAARKNTSEAGVEESISYRVADATQTTNDADLVVTDLPFGIRTSSRGLESLYSDFFDTLQGWDRLVVHTTREDLVPFEPTRTVQLRRGRLDAVLLVID